VLRVSTKCRYILVFKEYFVEHVLSFRYIEVDFGTQRFFVVKHSCSLNNEENINFFGVEYILSF
jgi:hypothetical protein